MNLKRMISIAFILVILYLGYVKGVEIYNTWTNINSLRKDIKKEADVAEFANRLNKMKEEYEKVAEKISNLFYSEGNLIRFYKSIPEEILKEKKVLQRAYIDPRLVEKGEGNAKMFKLHVSVKSNKVDDFRNLFIFFQSRRPPIFIDGFSITPLNYIFSLSGFINTDKKVFYVDKELYSENYYVAEVIGEIKIKDAPVPEGYSLFEYNGKTYIGRILDSNLDRETAEVKAESYKLMKKIVIIGKKETQ